MKISVTFLGQSPFQDSLEVRKKITDGKFTVYQVYSSCLKKNYALKIFPNTSSATSKYEREKILLALHHQNVVQSFPISCHSNKFNGVLTEFSRYGNFFHLVTGGAISSEILARTYFRQLIEGLEHIHGKGVAHLDLKLENLMLGSDFLLKIIDFDASQFLTDKIMTSAGTSGYRAPEVMEECCRDLIAADIYSAGIILFAFLTKEFPFVEIQDGKENHLQYYYTFMEDNAKFWKMKVDHQKDKMIFHPDLIELINGMLQYDPQKRLKIKEIKSSKWYNGPILRGEALKEEIEAQIQKMNEKK